MYDRGLVTRFKREYDYAREDVRRSRNCLDGHPGKEALNNFRDIFQGCLIKGHWEASQFPLWAIFNEFVPKANDFIELWRAGHFRFTAFHEDELAAFQDIIGCIVYAVAAKALKQFPLSNLVQTIRYNWELESLSNLPSSVPGVSSISEFGLSSDWIESPLTARQRSKRIWLHAEDILNSSDSENAPFEELIGIVHTAATEIGEFKEQLLRDLLAATDAGRQYAATPPSLFTEAEATEIKELILYLENYPLSVVRCPLNSAECSETVVTEFKISERGRAVLVDSDIARLHLKADFLRDADPSEIDPIDSDKSSDHGKPR